MRPYLPAALLLAIAAPAAAQTLPADALIACAATIDDAARLACYDRAVAAMSARARSVTQQREAGAAEQRGRAEAAAAAAAAAAEARAAEARKASFGRESMRSPPPDPAAGTEDMDSLESRVTEVLTDAGRRLVFMLDNGQIWRQSDTRFAAPPRPGMAVVLKRGSLGSFRMLVPERKQVIWVVRVR